MIRLLFIDDQTITLKFLENCFSDSERYTIVGTLTKAALVPIWCERKSPHAIFMDIQTKEEDTNGLHMAEIIKKDFPDIKILMMTGFDEISYLPRAKEIGVEGFILKSQSEDFFQEALDKVLIGEKVFPEEIPVIPVLEDNLPLSQREIEVLRLICEDYSNKEIANILSISESTVKRHIESLLRKTGKVGRAGLVAHAMIGGWINPEI